MVAFFKVKLKGVFGRNLKITITHRCLNFVFLIGIIGFNLVTSVSRDQNFHQYPCSIWLYDSVSHIMHISVFSYKFDMFFFFNFWRQGHQSKLLLVAIRTYIVYPLGYAPLCFTSTVPLSPFLTKDEWDILFCLAEIRLVSILVYLYK